jgi:serine/threonine-protein kinase
MANVLREPLVLPEDLLVIPVSELPEDVRQKLGDGGEEFALTRPLARQPSKLIDASAARLIERFRKPHTIVQAVISYSREYDADPERTLEESLPLLRQMIGAELLVPAEADLANAIVVTLAPGDRVGEYRVIRSIQVLDDSELYQARGCDGSCVALKIARPKRAAQMRQFFAREETALRRLAGRASPRLIESGTFDGRQFLATSWIPGIDAIADASRLRSEGSRKELLALLLGIARAYANLHGAGVLHGDIHPGNLLIGRQGEVTLIDFGLSQLAGSSQPRGPRGGVGFFLEPEYAEAALKRHPLPPTTELSEQFAVAALIYLLATGEHYMDFTLEEEGLLRQIADAAPLPFDQRGIDPWPKLEAALASALARDPEKRFPDMSAFADALSAAAVDAPAPAVRSAEASEVFWNGVLEQVGLEGPLFRTGLPQAPRCSVNFGAAGIAYALYRMACRRDDPRLLSMAEAWIAKAQQHSDREDAFTNREMDITEATVGRVSHYHGRPGVHLVRALIGEAGGDVAARDAAVSDYLLSVESEACRERDLTLGRSGAVLACATLFEMLPDIGSPLRQRIRGVGEELLRGLWSEVADFDALAQGRQWPNLGIAHGWGGLMYATLRWHAIAGVPLPVGFGDRLAQLVECARPVGRGIEWPWRHGADGGHEATMPGWCNGSAGMVHLASLARAVLGDESHLAVAEAAAWHVWDQGDGPVDLCCGFAGRAYALLELFRATGEPVLLRRAKSLVARAIRVAPQLRTTEHPPHSLYKGELGLAVLISDLGDPSEAAMPLFASERWQVSPQSP